MPKMSFTRDMDYFFYHSEFELHKMKVVTCVSVIYNYFHNIVRLADVLPFFHFTTSEMMHNYYLKIWHMRVASQVLE